MSVFLRGFSKAILFSSFLFLCACNGDKAEKAVKNYIQSSQNALPPIVPPKPVPRENFTAKYEATNIRDPFSSSEAAMVSSKKYPNAILQQYTLDSLHLIGILHHERKTWAVLSAPDEKIYKIFIGTRIGSQQALVTKITENSVILETEQGAPNQKKESTLVLEKK